LHIALLEPSQVVGSAPPARLRLTPAAVHAAFPQPGSLERDVLERVTVDPDTPSMRLAVPGTITLDGSPRAGLDLANGQLEV
jgi:hypothetical protein